ncbi:hypothetical protein [Priestia flexa]|uniref:hypothetical protein n=1 Tax=Priestia flexa TaxID=86664 RepID=UPI0024918430|nr:hypothetical protein [Priestia flexa]
MLYQIRKAYNEGKNIEIMYINQKSQITQRVIKILEIHEHVITAYCYKQRSLRLFKIENILSGQIVKAQRKNRGA